MVIYMTENKTSVVTDEMKIEWYDALCALVSMGFAPENSALDLVEGVQEMLELKYIGEIESFDKFRNMGFDGDIILWGSRNINS